MRRYSFIFIFLSFFFLFPENTSASIVTINPQGEAIVNVLSDQDVFLEIPKSESLKVNEVKGVDEKDGSTIALAREEDKVVLTVDGEDHEKSLDVTNLKEDLIEIEERPSVEKISIKLAGDKFVLKQDNLIAFTDYQIKVNPEIAGITLGTPSGFRFLSIFPKSAVETVLRAKVMNKINNSIEINEGSDGVLSYIVSGERVINLFNLYEYSVPVEARVSASTAEVLSVDQPEWLRILGFLFV